MDNDLIGATTTNLGAQVADPGDLRLTITSDIPIASGLGSGAFFPVGVAVDEVPGLLLRQAVAEHVERFSGVTGARDDETAFLRKAHLILDAGNEPGCVGIVGIDDGRKAEARRILAKNFGAGVARIVRAKDSVVVLNPDSVG